MAIEAAEQELWRRYREESDVAARDFLFLRYSSWAKSVAASVARRVRLVGMEWSDHLQNAQVGLLEAMSRYDVQRGIDFMAYAKPRVRGAVFNGMRVYSKEPPMASGSRVLQERMDSLQADELDDPLAGFIEAVVGLSLGYLLETGDGSGDQNPADAINGFTPILRDALLDLPVRQREVLIAHYLRQVPFQEIASNLGLTKGRISQIHKAGLLGLRQALRERRLERDSFF